MGSCEKTLNFFKIAICDKVFVESVSNGIISLNCLGTYLGGFLADNQKNFKVGKPRKYDENNEYFEKTFPSVKKESLPKYEGDKICQW